MLQKPCFFVSFFENNPFYGAFLHFFLYFCNKKKHNLIIVTMRKKNDSSILRMVMGVLPFLLFIFLPLNAKVVLPQLFQSGMVLQRGKTVPLWGKADAGEQVTVKWQKKQYSATADADGRWRIDLPKMKAGGPFVLEVSGENGKVRILNDVLVGDV